MKKIDYKKELKHLYKPSQKAAEIVDVPKMNFLMIDGEGNPNTAKSFSDAVEALYSVAYTLKFMIKKGEIGVDYGVLPLEGLWWADDMTSFTEGKKDDWKWTLMIMQPEYVDAQMVEIALAEVKKKKNPTALPLIRFESFSEGKSAHIMYIGSYSDEGPTIAKLHEFIKESGSSLSGKHHEIYLSDARRTSPEKLKTIIRQPMRD